MLALLFGFALYCMEVDDFWAMVFNPSWMDRLFHTLCDAWQAGAFLVVSVSAWCLLKRKHQEFARASLRIGLILGLAASLLQLLSSHSSAQGVAEHQPVNLAAFEGHYETTANVPLAMLGWVDEENEKVIGPKIPGMLSFLAHNDTAKPVTGLRQAAPTNSSTSSAAIRSNCFLVNYHRLVPSSKRPHC